MRKLLSIFSLVLLYSTIAFGQDPEIKIPLVIVEGIVTQPMYVGLDVNATTCQDLSLGEFLSAPFPPTGAFGVYLDLTPPPFNCFEFTTYWDYREAPSYPFSGTVQHLMAWQKSSPSAVILVEYDLPAGASMRIQDILGGLAGLDIGPFFNSGTATIPATFVLTSAYIFMDYDNISPPTGPEPGFAIDPEFYDFGSVFVGSSADITATISNTGDADLTVTQPAPVFDFSVTGTFPFTIAPGDPAVPVTVTFDPAAAGYQSGDLLFPHNAAGSPFLFAVTGTGAGIEPIFSVDPTFLDFGDVTPNTSEDDYVTVTNDGLQDDLVVDAAIAAAEYVVNPPSATILTGQSQVFTVTFTPPAVGTYPGILEFTHNAVGSPDEVDLTGDGYIPPAVFGLVFDEIEVDRYEDATYFNYMHLLDTDGPLHAIQFNLATNQEIGDEIILTYQSIEKSNVLIEGDNWILETNVVRGTINANGASQDIIYVLLYNIDATGDLPAGNFNDLLKVNYKTAKLPPPPVVEQISTFKINDVEGSTFLGFPVKVEPSRDILTVNVQAAGGGYGDVNGDGCVDILDLMLVVDHILERELLTGDAFTRANIAPWYHLDPLPTPDAVVNVQDLSVIQNIILTGLYPNGEPVSACGYLAKLEGAADATVTIFINSEGISTFVDAEIGIRGAQIEFRSVSNNPENMIINTPLGQGYYLLADELLRTLMYDRNGQKSIDAGVNNFMADMPFVLNNPNDVSIAKIVLVDINTEKMSNILVQVIYGTPSLPLDYILFQNYPNPFNPTTDVRFQIPETGDVTIKIYDMLGQEIRTLFSGVTQRGTYTVQWDGLNNTGSKMSSGTYIYRMTTGDFVQSKKMMLLK